VSNSVSAESVFAVANEIAKTGDMPTVAQVRADLGNKGSISTIHKYLTQWRAMLLKHAGRVNEPQNLSLAKENLILKQNIEQLTNLLTTNSAELNDAEYKIQELDNKIADLQKEKHEDQIKIAVLETAVSTTEKILEGLKDEMRQIHQNAVEMIRQNSDNFHLQLMQEKIKVINLEEKLRAQTSSNTITQNKDLSSKKSQISLASFLDNLNPQKDEYYSGLIKYGHTSIV
jgi:chromosome segregation ATPase